MKYFFFCAILLVSLINLLTELYRIGIMQLSQIGIIGEIIMKQRKSAILQMLYGEKGHVENIEFQPEEEGLLDAVDKSYELLCKNLKANSELLEQFQKYKECLEDLHVFETDKYYAEGFKFGVLIGVEAGESK